MNLLQIAFLGLVFLAVFAGVTFAVTYFRPTAAQERLREFTPKPQAGRNAPSAHWVDYVAKLTSRFGKLSIPEEGWEDSGTRTRFMNAGIRGASAPVFYFGAKTLLALGLLGLGLNGRSMHRRT